jgi:hypothetical protein
MLTKTKIALSIAMALGAIAIGPAMAKHRSHGHHVLTAQRQVPAHAHQRDAEGYASPADCAARLPPQPGDAAILIQDRFFRETNGDPFWFGECR